MVAPTNHRIRSLLRMLNRLPHAHWPAKFRTKIAMVSERELDLADATLKHFHSKDWTIGFRNERSSKAFHDADRPWEITTSFGKREHRFRWRLTLETRDAGNAMYRTPPARTDCLQLSASFRSNGALVVQYIVDRTHFLASNEADRAASYKHFQSCVGKILILDTAKGGVASAWMLREMATRGIVPLGIVFNTVNPNLVQGPLFGDITMMAGFDLDITAQALHGSEVEVDPGNEVAALLDLNPLI